MIVWVAVADYGLNGAGVLAVYGYEPSREEIASLESTNFPGAPYAPRSVTGYGGIHVQHLPLTEGEQPHE